MYLLPVRKRLLERKGSNQEEYVEVNNMDPVTAP